LASSTDTVSLHVKAGRWIAPLILFLVDYPTIVAALVFSVYLRNTFLPHYLNYTGSANIDDSYIYGIIPLLFLGLTAYEGLYTKRLPMWEHLGLLFKVTSYASILAVGVLFFSHIGLEVSRLFIFFTWILSFLFLAISRGISKKLLFYSGLWQKPVVIVGAGKTAELLADAFQDDSGMGYKIVGLIEDQVQDKPLLKEYPLLGNFAAVEQAITESKVQDVILATPGLERAELLDLVNRIQPHVDNLAIVPDLFNVPMTNVVVETFFNQKVVLLKMKNNMTRPSNRCLKLVFDYVASFLGLLLLAPVMAILALAIHFDSPGPIIFAHYRVGANGKKFPCYKFRSMVINAPAVLQKYLEGNAAARKEWEQDFKLKKDPRLTKVGVFIRKTSLDELPQLFNVLKGDMSLVGPRPIIDQEVAKYGEYICDYYLVRPGITGHWQVSGRNNVDYDTRVSMDSWYVRNWSFWQDIVILIKTFSVVLKRKGAY
jgi:Undecaprenyl-phosphate galactose phosphotransferase WbaP